MRILIILSVILVQILGFPSELNWWTNTRQYDDFPDLAEQFSAPITKQIQNRIVGGDESEPHAYPYTVGLNILTTEGGTVWCGGSIISDEWVLTAAHCLKKARDMYLYIGCHRVNEPDCNRIRISRKNFKIHEGFNSRSLEHDIALIKLPGALILEGNINSVSLARLSHIQPLIENHYGTSTGWGYYGDVKPKLSQYLRFVKTKIISQESCRKYYRGMVKRSNLCTDGLQGKSTCFGDSGGPLTYEDAGKTYIIGITSYGYRLGCEKGWPSVFTRVSSYLYWIQERTGLEVFE